MGNAGKILIPVVASGFVICVGQDTSGPLLSHVIKSGAPVSDTADVTLGSKHTGSAVSNYRADDSQAPGKYGSANDRTRQSSSSKNDSSDYNSHKSVFIKPPGSAVGGAPISSADNNRYVNDRAALHSPAFAVLPTWSNGSGPSRGLLTDSPLRGPPSICFSS